MVGEKLRLEENNKGPRFAHGTHPEPLDETQHVREIMKGFKCSPEVKAQLVRMKFRGLFKLRIKLNQG